MYECLNEVHIGIDRGDDFILPGLNDDATIIEDPWDNGFTQLFGQVTDWMSLKAKSDATGGRYKTIIETNNQDSNVINGYISSSRLVFLCPKWKRWKGSGAIGLLIAAGANKYAGSKSPEESKGLAFLGQIRFEWLTSIGFQEKSYGINQWGAYYRYVDDDEIEWELSFGLHKFKYKIEAAHQATSGVLQSVAKYRLAMTDEKNPEYAAFLEEYANGKPILVEKPKEVAWVHLPHAYKAPLGKQFRPNH